MEKEQDRERHHDQQQEQCPTMGAGRARCGVEEMRSGSWSDRVRVSRERMVTLDL